MLEKVKQITAFILIGCIMATAFIGTDIYYNIGDKAYAAELVGTSNGTSGDQTIKGAQNMGTIDNSSNTTYWFAGNAFYGMNRGSIEFGESYDTSDWLLVDTDAMWGGNYLYSTWGNGYNASGSDLYTYSNDTENNFYYYQKILSYGEALWAANASTWFTGEEANAVGTATVTTTNSEYRTYEDYISGTTTSNNTYNYWLGAANATDIANGNYSITSVKKWYESSSKDTTKYLTLTAAQDATVYENSAAQYYTTYNFQGFNDGNLNVKSSNIYTIIGAHLYAPSVTELQSNESVYKKIIKNVKADYLTTVASTGYPSAASTAVSSDPITANFYDRSRTDLWSRSFAGLRMGNSYFGAWSVNANGNLYSDDYVTSSRAVAPAFNLDTSSVVMARSATASNAVSSELASYNPNSLGSNVEFSLESDVLSLTTDIAGKKLNNVVAGQTYDIAYSGASLTGEAHNANASELFYVSGAIYNENDEMIYYGKLSAVDKSGAGTVSITIPESLEAGKTYKLALFEEQVIGTYNVSTPSGNSITTYTTDYVSPMNVATFTLDSLSATVNDDATLLEETSYSLNNIANLITVTSASQGTLTYGTDYTFTAVTGDANVNGATITTGDNGSKDAQELTFEISYLNESMQVVPTTTVTFTVNSSDTVNDDTYQGDQESEADENGFYTWKDEVSGITWKYKTNDIGNVSHVYTTDDPSVLIDAAGTLNIPSKVAGLTIVGIGGGTEDTPVVSMTDGTWTKVSFPETVTTINDYAFVKAQQQSANIIIPSTITKIGAKAFYKSTIASVKINGMSGEIGYLAFGNCSNLSNVVIKGYGLTLNEEAFSSSAITSLTLNGNITVKKNAFKNVVGITELYVPNGVDLEAYAFNGCSGIETLEVNTLILGNNAFSGCTAIDTLILDDNVTLVEYDWNGHTSSTDRNIYVKNGNIKFQFYNADLTYYSAYGTSGNVRVVYDEGTDEGASLTPASNVLTAITKTLASHFTTYESLAKGQAASVTYVYDAARTVEQIMAADQTNDVIETANVQTGIEVTFDGTLLTTQPIDKNKVSVVALFGNVEGLTYDTEHFYVIRTEEFNSLSRNSGITEEAIAACEPLTAQDSDLQNGLSAAIVVFTTVAEIDGVPTYTDIENDGYFYANVSVRVEEYSDEDYVKETYGSYTDIVEEIAGLNGDISDMESSMKDIISSINTALGTSFDVNAEDIVTEYENAVAALSEALSSSLTENEGNIAEVQTLIASVNATYGSDITLSDDATTEQISDAITEALEVISNDQTEKENLIASLKEQYVEIAKMLSDYMENEENMEADAVDGTTIAEIKSAITAALADLEEAKAELNDIDVALDNLYNELLDAMTNVQNTLLTDETGETAAEKLESISNMISILSASYEANNDYLRSCIAEIDKAFGYGDYVKYNEKYVFYIYSDDVYYIKGTDARTYLTTEDSGMTFVEAENQEELAETYDAVDGAKFFYLTDTTNGWQPWQNNPLSDFKAAMASLLNGFNEYTDSTVTLIATINTICGYEEGDENYISIPANATADQINATMKSALTAVNTQLETLDAQNQVYSQQYAEAAQLLSEFMENEYEDAVASENAAEITAAVRKATAELTALRTEMSDINEALDNLYAALDDAFSNMGLGGVPGTATDDEETTAEKIDSISGMIAIITDSYNQLSADYDALSSDYQTVLNYVYGEDEKQVGQVTPEQIQEQIEKNQQEAIDKAVEEALAEADAVKTETETLQAEIATTIDAILEGEEVTTDGLSQELVTALENVQEMQANVTSMQASVDGYESFLTTLKNALELSDAATTADVIAAIQSLKDQIATLSEQVNTLTTENATLKAENLELQTQIEAGAGNYDEGYAAGFAAGQASVDTDGSYQDGYAKGYAEGQASVDTSDNSDTYKRGYNEGYAAGKAENSSNTDEDSEAYSNGYNAGYAAGVKSVDTSTTGPTYTAGYNAGYLEGFTAGTSESNIASDEQIAELTTKIESLTVENTTLSNQVSVLKENNAELADELSTLTNANTALTNRISTLTEENATLKGQVSALSSQVNSLTSQLEAALKNSGSNDELVAQVTALTAENATLSAQVSTLTDSTEELNTKVTSLTNANTSLTNRVNTLTSEKATLTGQVNTLKSQVSSLTSQLEKASEENEQDTTKDEQVSESTESINVESTEVNKNSSIVTSTEPKYDLGTVVETVVPNSQASSQIANDQVATTELNELGNSRAVLTTNANSTTATSEVQLNNAYLILTYYMNHLDELGDLGSEEIKEAATDESKQVVFDVLSSVNVKASDVQLEEIESNGKTTLTLSSDDFVDGELYLVIHESSVRTNMFDVLLVSADNNELSFDLPDLSPVTVTKISIKNSLNTGIDKNTTITEPETETENGELVVESVDSDATETNETFGGIVKILLVIAIGALVVIVLHIRRNKRKDG